MERRLAEIPTEEWGDVQVDITPREYVLDYLAHSFPTQLFEPFTDGEGNLSSRPVYRDGQPVQCREAVARRDRLIEQLASLAAGPGRARPDRPALRHRHGRRGHRPLAADRPQAGRPASIAVVENRAGSANLAETQAFMDDDKRILVFSDAGGTGRSYHADSRRQEPAPARPLSAGGRLEGRHRHPGPGPHQPHQPGAAAAVPADRHRREGREALPLDHRAAARHAGRHHQGPAPDRRAGPVPRRGQSRKPLCAATRCASSTCCCSRQGRGLLARGVSRRPPGCS